MINDPNDFDILAWLDDAPIQLVAGLGAPSFGGCWMSALSKYAGECWTDHPDCVDPLIRPLCISANDILLTDSDRGEVIGPVLLEPVGTRCYAVRDKRVEILKRATRQIREHVICPHAEGWARAVVDGSNHDVVARSVARVVFYAAKSLPDEDRKAFVKNKVIPIILELCAVWNSAPKEMACSVADFKAAVQCGDDND